MSDGEQMTPAQRAEATVHEWVQGHFLGLYATHRADLEARVRRAIAAAEADAAARERAEVARLIDGMDLYEIGDHGRPGALTGWQMRQAILRAIHSGGAAAPAAGAGEGEVRI